MADSDFDKMYSSFSGKQPSPAATAQSPSPKVASGSSDWDSMYANADKVGGTVTAPQQAPKASQEQPQHGMLWNMANKALNYSTDTQDKAGGQNPSMLDRISSYIPDPLGMAEGAAKGIVSTSAGLGSIYNKLTGSNQPFNQENLAPITDPKSASQHIGKIGEGIAEFASGEGAIGKVVSKPTVAKMLAGLVVGGAQSGGSPAQTAVSTVLPGVFSPEAANVLGKTLSSTLGLSTGAGKNVIERAFSSPESSNLVKAMRGDIGVNDIVSNVQKSVSDFSDAAKDSYRNSLDTMVKNNQIPNWTAKATGMLSDVKNSLTNEMGNFGAVIKTDGTLNLRHVAPGDRPAIQSMYDEVSKWGSEAKDLTASGMDTLKKDIIGPYSGEEGKVGAMATRVYNTAKDGMESNVPGYADMTKDYAQSQDLLRKLKSEMSVSANGQGNPGLIARKLATLMKQSTDYKQSLLEKLPNGKDLTDQIAGFSLSTLMPKGITGVMAGTELAGAMLHPVAALPAAATAAMGSPRIVGEATRMAGKVAKSPSTGILSNLARRGIQTGINQNQ